MDKYNNKDLVINLFKAHKGIFLTIVGVWLIYFLSVIGVASDLSLSSSPAMSIDALNSFGGNFNVLTSLFTGLAFAGVIISVILQTQELKETRTEFAGQRKALQGQEFDNKFFRMLNLLNKINANLKLDNHQGDEVFKELHSKLTEKILSPYDEDVKNKSVKADKKEYFNGVFNEFNSGYDTTFKYYFLNLYQVLKYIDDKCPEDEAKRYSNMVRAQLSKNELILLAYNALGVQNFTTDAYQKYIEKYSLLEHLKLDDFLENNTNVLEIIVNVLAQYDKTAFGENDKFVSDLKNMKAQYENNRG